jgi:hypothetical protein
VEDQMQELLKRISMLEADYYGVEELEEEPERETIKEE